MPVVQKFKRFVDKVWGPVFFFTCGFTTQHGGSGVGCGKAHPAAIYSPRLGQVGQALPEGPSPPSPCGEPGPASAVRRLPAAVGGASSGSAPSFQSPLLSLLGQKLGPCGGSSCRLQTKAEAPPG